MFRPTVKPVFFAWPLFREFRDLGDFTKITDRKYSESHRYYYCCISSESKTPKLKAPKFNRPNRQNEGQPNLWVFSALAGGDRVGISWRCLIKLEWLGYRMVKKLWQYVKPFSSNTGTSRTDGQTDRRTDGHNCYISIALTRDTDISTILI